ncbi:hypothetical protein D9615_000264 [Tricholomella constricta]|uniref:C3H1-type domain-containing protein n=1 Tax=Tricholomella constricta TaxID=117010 RepID=A0A8H5HRE4_9AGAR|nr:hypothetical protein D9615_000264 [Tricholomella constricta]
MFYDTNLNEATKDIRPPSPPQPHRVGYCFEQLRGEILNLLGNETFFSEKIQKLEAELSVYKRAYNDVDSELRLLEKLKQDAVKEKEDLENQIKGYRVVTLLDGDGAIFSGDLIAQGRAGGHAAAQKLSDSILQHLSSTFGANQYQLWVYVFFNKRGLVDTFGRVGNMMAKVKFEDFMMGFNQAAERFLMVDVGDAKEAADAKIKARLEDEIRLPQTYKIIFGGCHDNGYVTNLRSQITAGFKQKLILLRSYTDMAAGIADLELPVLTISDLFLTQKLVTLHSAPVALAGQIGHNNSSPRVGPTQCTASVPTLALSELDQAPISTPEPTAEVGKCIPPRRPSIPSSYSSAVQFAQKRASTPDLDSGSSTSEASDDLPERTTPTFRGSRHVNPNIPLTKHKPPPCTLFYLANCKHGADCKYGHDYILDAEHFTEIRSNAKKAPCPAINKDLSTATVKRNAELENRVNELEVELSVWKQAHSVALEASEREIKAHNVQVSALNRQISNLDCFRGNQNPLILCVVNGDENIFIRDLLVQGQQGGRAAAQQLTKSIAEYLSNEDVHIFGRLSFWITVYYNRLELDDLLRTHKVCTPEQFEGFLAGFSQSSPRFLMVDVGFIKDFADTKIKEYLQTYTRFPQTLRVFFGGGQSDISGYISMFNALEKEQLLGKIVLLHSSDLDVDSRLPSLPRLNVDGLFMTEKLYDRGFSKLSPLTVGPFSTVTTNGGLISPQSPARVGGRMIDPSLNEDHDDLKPSATPGYKPSAAKSPDEYAQLDAEDESLARWKASLGIVPGAAAGDTNGPKVTILTLELDSPTLPAGKKIVFDLKDTARLADTKKNPIVIKEGVEYNVRITFKVNHSIISGVRYIQVVKRAGVKVDKLEQMLGSYGPSPTGEPYTKNFDPEESPSGMLARSGSYAVRSRVVDDDGEVYADWEWSFKLAKEW